MLLQRQLKLLGLLSSIALAAGIATSGMASYAVSEETRQIEHAETTVRGITHFRYLTMEMALYGDARTRQQWRERFASFRQALSGHVYGSKEEQALQARGQANLLVLDRLFHRLETETPDASTRHASVVSALFMTTQDMLDDGFELIRLNRIDLRTAQQQAVWSIIASIVLLNLLIITMISTVRRRVLGPLAALQRVTEQVSEGDLGARLNFYARDELGSLGSAFDHMTSELQQSYDAMQRKSAELALAQESLQSFIDYTPALVVYWDKDLRNRFANRAYETWLGLAPQEMRGKHISEVIGPERFALIEAQLKSVLQGNSEMFERSVPMPSGETREALFSYVPDIRKGQVQGLYGFVSDITPLKRAEADRAQAFRQLQSVVSAAGDFAIVQCDTRGKIKLFSAGAERILGYSTEDMVNRATPALFHVQAEIDERGAALTRQLGRKVAGFEVFATLPRENGSESRDWTYRCKDGRSVPVNLTVSCMRDEAGAIVGYLGIAKDVSAERDVRRVLAEARDQAEQASLAKSRFLANMSHEIRTPMNAVLGMLELLQYTELSALQRDYAMKSHSAARSLLGLLNDILDFSQVEANKITLECAAFEVDAMLRELSTILSSLVGAKDVDIVYAVGHDVPALLQGDVARLRQILINLASNAIKFTEHGEVVVGLRVMHQSPTHYGIEFSVRDTGIGIAQDKLGSIFEGFTQAETSTTRRFGGTGLGLTISQRLVQLMGGELRVESNAGVGSCFHFLVDFPRAAADDGRPAAVPASLPVNLRVLIAEDNAVARDMACGIATAFGWTAVGAGDCAQALAMLPPRCDVALLDWSMPDTDGASCARRLREFDPAMPIVALVTAQARSALAERLTRDPALVEAMLTKPFTRTMLREAVKAALAGVPIAGAQVSALPVTGRLSGQRLLVVDDNSMNRQVARELLRHEGAQVTVADSGELALQTVREEAGFDAVLMDVQMPGMDGYACTRAMRGIDAMRSVPIIAMTANVMASDRAACLAAGMNDHLGKPLDIEVMVAMLRQHVHGEGRRAQHAPAAPVPVTRMDFEAALRRLGGNRALFMSLSEIFVIEAARFRAHISVALFGQDWKEAATLLHTFKSAAGTVGAAALQSYVASLERQVRGQPELIDAAGVTADLDGLVASSMRELERETEAMAQLPVDAPAAAAPAGMALPLVMVVDDQAINIQILHGLLRDQFEMCMALNGADALALCAQRRPDIILLDIVMPEMDGYEVCKRLKADPATRDIPVIFVTGHVEPAERARGAAAGAADFITKPFDADDVADRLNIQIAAHGQARLVQLSGIQS